MPPKGILFVTVVAQLVQSVQNKLHKCMQKKFIFEIVTKTVLALVTLTVDLMTPTSIGFLRHPGWMCGQSLRRVGKGVLEFIVISIALLYLNCTHWPMLLNNFKQKRPRIICVPFTNNANRQQNLTSPSKHETIPQLWKLFQKLRQNLQ